MDAMKAILTRRSVRNYNKRKIPETKIKEILKAAVSAPSAGNEQPWHFILINQRNILDGITNFHPHSKMLLQAQFAIIVCGDTDLEKYKGYWMVDCSAATQNILLAARALGLGACWLGIYPREERIKALKDMMKTPDNIIPFSIVSIGYTDQDQKPVERLDEFRLHRNKW